MAESSPLAHSPTLVATSPGGGDDLLAAGATAGEYVIERFLGGGAMGEVYAGRHPVIGKRVAVKVLKHDLAGSAEAAERFIREARAVNQVDHPNVIDVFAFGRLDDGRLYLVMDLVDGKSLRKALIDGPLEVQTALHVLGQIADALDAAHARGVVHRDLKPDNVMLGNGTPPSVFVLDFGIAKLIAADGVAAATMLTGKGTWLGTPGYMAPEQWSADGAGPASDRYALGVMAFELLSGTLPFQAGTLPQMMEQHFRSPVPALSTRGAVATHATFDPVITRAMAKDPDARFATGREMVDALRVAAGVSSRGARTRTHGSGARRQWVPAAAGVGVLGLSMAAFLAVKSGGRSDEPAARAPRPPGERPPEGRIRVDVLSIPPGAQVSRDGRFVGSTPLSIDARPGDALAFDVKKPGYASRHFEMTAAEDATLPAFTLEPITGYEGVWALPGGELRAFQRDGDTVAVSKLKEARGEREFFRKYELVPADDGVSFAHTEDVVDDRAPNDPSCHVPHRVEYHYDPRSEALTLKREQTKVDLRGGHCVTLSREFGEPEPLARIDGGDGHARDSLAPAGQPVDVGKRAAQDSFDNSIDQQLKATNSPSTSIDDAKMKALSVKRQSSATPVKPSPTASPKPIKKVAKKPVTSATLEPQLDLGQAGSKDAPNNAPNDAPNNAPNNARRQPLNDPAPNAPQAQEASPQQQAPQQQAPQQLGKPTQPAQPRGDSQVAPRPQVQKRK